MAASNYNEIRRTLRASCERMGIEAVRKQLASDRSLGIRREIMLEWLKDSEPLHRDARDAAERERDREIAREANAIASEALTKSSMANFISGGALLLSFAAFAAAIFG